MTPRFSITTFTIAIRDENSGGGACALISSKAVQSHSWGIHNAAASMTATHAATRVARLLGQRGIAPAVRKEAVCAHVPDNAEHNGIPHKTSLF